MLTKVKVAKTVWVGMTEEQKNILCGLLANYSKRSGMKEFLSPDSINVLDDLRQALLNV